jgi:hypothetical protein
MAKTTSLKRRALMAAPERVALGVYRVDAVGFSNAISVLLLEDAEGWTPADTSLGSNLERIRNGLVTLGATPEALKRVTLHITIRITSAACRA